MEVLYDDRKVSAGVMFSDADLMGVPIRVIASPRNMKEGCCEIVTRYCIPILSVYFVPS